MQARTLSMVPRTKCCKCSVGVLPSLACYSLAVPFALFPFADVFCLDTDLGSCADYAELPDLIFDFKGQFSPSLRVAAF